MQTGRKPKLTPEQVAEVRDMYNGTWTVAWIARYFKVSAAIIHRVLNREGPYKS